MDKYIDFDGFKKLCERIVSKTAKKASLDEHIGNKSNPHGVTKSQVGLGNVPNVATNNQTPTYTAVETLAKLVTGEKLGVAFGKIAKAVDELITHLADNVRHVTAAERTAWNGKAAGNHTHDAASSTANGFMSAADKTKLDGIATGANKYTHPTSAGNKHIPSGGASGQILRWSADGTAEWGADNNTTYGNMSGASASSAGKAGLVPAPAAGAQAKYLRGDGTWQTPPDTNTTYAAATQSANGLMSAADKKKLDTLKESVTVSNSNNVTITEIIYNNSVIRLKLVVSKSITIAGGAILNIKASAEMSSDNNVIADISGYISTCMFRYTSAEAGFSCYLANSTKIACIIPPGTYYV